MKSCPASTLDHSLQRLTAAYNERFENMYRLPDEFNGRSDYDALKRFSKDITANLLGGIGYFYGTSIVDKGFAYEWDQEDEPVDSVDNDKEGASKESGAKMTEPRSLLTATPSRSFFPRGFYWSVLHCSTVFVSLTPAQGRRLPSSSHWWLGQRPQVQTGRFNRKELSS
jgi:hypothetical protein